MKPTFSFVQFVCSVCGKKFERLTNALKAHPSKPICYECKKKEKHEAAIERFRIRKVAMLSEQNLPTVPVSNESRGRGVFPS
jgi:predicted amidophosphoribosyltransferase